MNLSPTVAHFHFCDKPHDQSDVGESVCFILQLPACYERVKAGGTRSQEQSRGCGETLLTALSLSPRLPELTFQTPGPLAQKRHLSGLGHPTSIANQEDAPPPCLRTSLMEAFSQWRFLFPDDSSLCRVDKELSSTPSQGLHSHPGAFIN